MKLNRKWLNEEFVDLSNVSDKDFGFDEDVLYKAVENSRRRCHEKE